MIKLGSGYLKCMHQLIPADLRSYRMMIITDNTVKRLYGLKLKALLANQGFDVSILSFPAGERYKTRDMKAKLESSMLKLGFGRDSCIIALGGGVVGDMAGFIAATYMRGIPYIQVPTTLLAILDSSIGGKTAVNTPEGKNLIGAFYEPRAVIADLDCLKTLPDKQSINGWIEALKIFLACDASAFKKAMKVESPTLALIQRAIAIKTDIVAQDPHEQHLRAVLNFGHTIGHALEKASEFRLMHGYAVGYGILVESTIALHRGLLKLRDHALIISALKNLGIEGSYLKRFDIKKVISLTHRDKKIKDRQLRYIVLKGIGSHTIDAVSDTEVRDAYKAVISGDYHARK